MGLNNLNSEATEFRIRTSLKEAKDGIIQRDLTVEFENGERVSIQDKKDIGAITNKRIAQLLWDLFEEMGEEGTKRNHRIAESNPIRRGIK